MSCKILTGDTQHLVRPLPWRVVGNGASKPASSQTSNDSAAGNTDGRELNKLHARVVELEQALQSEVRQARDRAYQEGLAAGRENAASELQPAMERLLRSCSEVAGLRARIRKETESDLVTLTVAIARRVLRRELSVDPEAIHGVVKAALSKLQVKEITLVRTNPEHLNAVRMHFEKAGIGGVEMTADATLPVGGLVLETNAAISTRRLIPS